MQKNLIRFLVVIFGLIAYTMYLANQVWPGHIRATSGMVIFLFVWMLGWQFLYRRKNEIFERNWFRALAGSGTFLLGFWGTFVFLSIPVNLLQVVVGAASHFGSQQNVVQDTHLVLLAISLGFTALGLWEALKGPRTKMVNVPFDSIPQELEGFKIVQISDLHVGPTIRKQFVERIVKQINTIQPDLVVLTGDVADAHAHSVAPHLEPLRELTSRWGNYYVTGNHEYYWGARELVEKLKGLGMVPLINENRLIDLGEKAGLLLAGVTDPTGTYLLGDDHESSLSKAVESSEPNAFRILLSHRPGICEEAEKKGVRLQLSGHTHAGQFFPFSLLIPLAHKYYRGLNRHGDLWLYVNPGTGYWGPGNRFGVPAEITILTLRSVKTKPVDWYS